MVLEFNLLHWSSFWVRNRTRLVPIPERDGPRMLRISKLTDYAIVLMSRMAAHEGETLTATSLADATRIGRATVTKLLKMLAAHGLLQSVQGRRGGYSLARSPSEIAMTDIIEAVEGPIAMTECTLHGSDCGIEDMCNTRDHWQHINRAVHTALAGVKLDALTEAEPPPAVVNWRPRADGAPR